MKIRTGRFGETVERLLPFLTMVAIVTCGYLWLLQPRLGVWLRTRSDEAALADRARTLQQAAGRGLVQAAVDVQASRLAFEKQVPTEDRVPDVAATLAKAVLASAPPDSLRAFTIETGDRVQSSPAGGTGDAPRAPGGPGADGSDPRLALFPYAVSYTPLRITFESTFDAAGSFLWRVRDLPTIVELRSATLTRGLPLMRVDVLLRVYQRGAAGDAGPFLAPGAAAPAPPSPTAPRVAQTPGEEGGAP